MSSAGPLPQQVPEADHLTGAASSPPRPTPRLSLLSQEQTPRWRVRLHRQECVRASFSAAIIYSSLCPFFGMLTPPRLLLRGPQLPNYPYFQLGQKTGFGSPSPISAPTRYP